MCPERKDVERNRLAKGSKGNRPPAVDALAYKGRNMIVLCLNRLKDFSVWQCVLRNEEAVIVLASSLP